MLRSCNSRLDRRLSGTRNHGMTTACMGCYSLAAATRAPRWASCSARQRRPCSDGVGRFEDSGFNGLREGDRPGRPRALDESQWRRMEADLRRTPREFGFEAGLWDGPLLSEHLRRNYGISLGVRQCQRLFSQTGFRLRKPRSQIAQSDPVRVAAVKKLRRLAKRDNVELWRLDECHFPRHGSRCRMALLRKSGVETT